MKSVAIVIPCYGDSQVLPQTLLNIQSEISRLPYEFHFVVIEDGSSYLNIDRLPTLNAPLCLLRHSINLGQGAALQTGFSYCQRFLNPDLIATMDADGQHNPKDLRAMLTAAEGDFDIIFGNRFLSNSEVPGARKWLLKMAVLFERKLTGLTLNDAHNGFRVFNRKTLQALKITQNRMAHATEIKQQIAEHGLRYTEIPVSIQYSQETLAKGQKNSGSLIIIRDLLKAYFFERT